MWYLEYPKDSTPAFDKFYKKVLNMAFIKNQQVLEDWMWLSQKEKGLIKFKGKVKLMMEFEELDERNNE